AATATPGANNSRQISLSWTKGAAPSNIAGVTVETEVFRRQLNKSGTPVTGYTKLSIPSPSTATNFTDSGLEKDTQYEYTFRSKATIAGSPITYSAVVAANHVRKATTGPDVFTTHIAPGDIVNSEAPVTTLIAGDHVEIDNISGRVNFNTAA